MACTVPATLELLARTAPLPHPVALELAATHPHDVAVNAALLSRPTPDRDELWAALWAARRGVALSAAESELAGFTASPTNIEVLLAPGGPRTDPVAVLRGVVRAGVLPTASALWDELCVPLRSLDPAVVSWECGELAAVPSAPARVRARVLELASVQHRVGAVLCTRRRLEASAAASAVWPARRGAAPSRHDDYRSLAALARCAPNVAAAVAERVAGDPQLSTLQRVAVWCVLGVWWCAPQLGAELAASAATLAALTPEPGAQGVHDPAARAVAALAVMPASQWAPPPAVRVALERWLGNHPRRAALVFAARDYEALWAALDDGRLGAWVVAGRPSGAAAAALAVRWDPGSLESVPAPFAPAPSGFAASAALLGTSEAAWRFALELADGSLSCSELFDLAAATI